MPDTPQQPATTAGRYLPRADAAAYVREKYGFPCSRQWLAKLAVLGGGPVFRRAGRFPVRRWLKEKGLPALTDRKPALILGRDLIGFLNARRAPKKPCRLDECYCFSLPGT